MTRRNKMSNNVIENHLGLSTYHVEGEMLLSRLVLSLHELFLGSWLPLELKRYSRLELASDLLSLVCLDANFFFAFFRAILSIWWIAESGIVGSHVGQLSISRSEKLLRALVSLRYRTVDWVGQRVARVVNEGAWCVVFSLTPWSNRFDVAFSIFSHGSNQASTFCVDKLGIVCRNKVSRWLVGHLELSALLIQVELPHLVVAEPIGKVLRVVRL